MRSIALCGTVFILAGVCQAADEALPKAGAVLDGFIEATGGKAAYQKRRTEIVSGTIEFLGKGVKGTVLTYAAEPDKTYVVADIAGVGKIESGTGDGVAWERTAILGPRLKEGMEKAEQLIESRFNSSIHWRELYSKAETVGSEAVEGEDCFKLVLTPGEGKPETVYFSKKTRLLRKRTKTAASQLGDVPVDVVMKDYKSFAGVLEPTTLVQKMAGQEFQIIVNSVKTNEAIGDDRFELPADVKALVGR